MLNHADVVDAFVAAVVRVMRMSMNEEVQRVTTHYAPDVDPPPSFRVSIELTGSLRGPVRWSFSRGLARSVAESMLMGEAAEEYYQGAVAELANMVLGSAAGDLERAGYLVSLRPPSPAEARRAGNNALVLDIESASGEMKLLFDLEEAA